jgi:integrase/recombinase XerC
MGRSTNGFTIVRSGDGAYRVRFTHDGRRVDRSTGSRDADEARRIGEAFFLAVTGGVVADRAAAPLGLEALFEGWLESIETQVCRATARTYALYVSRRFVPFFETLDRITTPRIAEYTRARLGAVKRRTLIKELSALRGFLGWCVELGHLEEAPRVASPPARAQGHAVHDRRVVELEAEEVAAILAHLPERGRGGSRPRAFYELMWETGLRTGTLARLSVPEDFERGRRVLTIRDEIDKARFGRELPLTARAVTVLDAVAPKRGLVFGQRDLRDALRRAARAAGLSAERAARISNHAFRHARATHLASRTDNLVGVAYLLGHKHLTTTAIYARPRQREARSVLRAVAGDAAGGDGSEEPPAAHRDAHQNSGEIVVRNALSEMNSGSCDGGRNSPNSLSLRKAGLEPARVLPRWNLKRVRRPTTRDLPGFCRVTNRHEPTRAGELRIRTGYAPHP